MVAKPKGNISHVHCKKIVGGNNQGNEWVGLSWLMQAKS